MLPEDHITKLLGIADVSVKNVEETAEEMRIYLETPVSFQICPVCHKSRREYRQRNKCIRTTGYCNRNANGRLVFQTVLNQIKIYTTPRVGRKRYTNSWIVSRRKTQGRNCRNFSCMPGILKQENRKTA